MGKTPFVATAAVCWLSLALAGCDTVSNPNTTLPQAKVPAKPLFGPAKDPTVSKNTPADAMAKDRPVAVDGSASGKNGGTLPADPAGPGAGASLPPSWPGGMNPSPTVPDSKRALPVVSVDDGNTTGTVTAGHAPLPPIKTDPTPVTTPVAFPPPPGGSGSMQLPPSAQGSAPLPPLNSQATRQITTAPPAEPPPPPPLPAGRQQFDTAPPLPKLKPIDTDAPIHTVPAPPPVPPAPPAPPPPVTEPIEPPPPLPVPYNPVSPKP